MVKEARDRGLTAPVILMGEVMCPALVVLLTDNVGYYNPLLAYGEQKAIQDASEAGANGFIVVDLPPEEAVYFREKCATARWVISHHPCASHDLEGPAWPMYLSSRLLRQFIVFVSSLLLRIPSSMLFPR